MRVAFVGLGLIGGSIAHALRARPADAWTTAAWSPNGAGPRRAFEDGVVDTVAPSLEAAIDGAGIVVLAAPPLECLALLDELGGRLRAALPADAVITDVASTKRAIVERAGDHGLRFVGGHPMAGRETAGFEAADADLFRGRPWLLVPPDGDPAALARVEAMTDACGAQAIRIDAGTHDELVAGISHLPLLLSVALVEAVAGTGAAPRGDWPDARRLAASGWASMTRLARGDVTMGAGIVATNAPAITSRLRDLRALIDEWIELLDAPDGPDAAAASERFAAAKDRLAAGDSNRG